MASSASICLLVKTKKICVPPAWVHRWQFLVDIIDFGSREANWTYTSLEELQRWMKLNELMDNETPIRSSYLDDTHNVYTPKVSPAILLSSIYLVIQFMNPVDGSYLLHCSIDEKVSDRLKYYKALGGYIRSRGEMMQCLNRDMTLKGAGMHHNFYLSNDPAYGVGVYDLKHSQDRVMKLSEMNEDVQDWIRQLPLDVPTALLYQGYYKTLTKGYKRTKEDNWMNEVPWYLLNWQDIATFCPGTIRMCEETTYGPYGVIRDLIKTDDEKNLPTENRTSSPIIKKARKITEGPRTYKSYVRVNAEMRIQRLIENKEGYYAPSELPYVLSDLPLPNRYDAMSNQVVLSVDKQGETSLLIPHADDFMTRLGNYIARVQYSRHGDDENGFAYLGSYAILGDVFIDRSPRLKNKKMHEMWYALYELGIATFCGERARRVIDSLEYPDVCRRIADTLGTKMLMGIANYFLTMVNDEPNDTTISPNTNAVITKRMDLFVDAAAEVIAMDGETPFQKWPTVYVEQKKMYKKKPARDESDDEED
jgi:hypothetical protein